MNLSKRLSTVRQQENSSFRFQRSESSTKISSVLILQTMRELQDHWPRLTIMRARIRQTTVHNLKDSMVMSLKRRDGNLTTIGDSFGKFGMKR
jgi:hypothetical protein